MGRGPRFWLGRILSKLGGAWELAWRGSKPARMDFESLKAIERALKPARGIERERKTRPSRPTLRPRAY